MAKTILITGADTGIGIGKDTAKTLLALGYTVHATTHSEAEVEVLRAELGGGAHVFKLDITGVEDRAKIADLNLDVLINNVAQNLSGSLADVKIDRVRRLFEVDLFSSLELTQIAIRGMIARGGGTVVFVSSITGHIPEPFVMPHSMPKFAISDAAAGLRAEMQELGKGIHGSVVEPRPYNTKFNRKLVESQFKIAATERSQFSPEQIAARKKAIIARLHGLEVGSTDTIVRKTVGRRRRRYPSCDLCCAGRSSADLPCLKQQFQKRRNGMGMAFRIAAGVPAIVFIVVGLAWLVAPGFVSAQMLMPLLAGDALSTQIGDLSAFFLTLGGSIMIALVTRRTVWLYPAIMLLAFAATGRVVAWLAHGAGLPPQMIVVEIVVVGVLIVLARRMAAEKT
ncbi:short-subunit dehydrogenase [Roseibium hamelinense]|uniref:Short-subunit dehydrogenase n=1 Tax=Roseibium hamelinense TaxID=150831 RepID=A0A562SCX9_9HYPH|nr:SDR family NAD(P)-dependent oxidoreductase [Roseibium hamelinense]MTI42164.1 SDR family NAD(P)-dependent oxidoreductase [Roseibium hamelinense]TWI78724.1 short-subunit dehydrogenase [Roseibium hamelinense]